MTDSEKPYEEWTAVEMFAAREKTEREAASLLGEFLFEFGRLDMAQGLCLVWHDGGRELESLTIKASVLSFGDRLELMKELLKESSVHGSEKEQAYRGWIADAHRIRKIRNKLAHGRWGVEAHGRCVFHVSGLPTSPDQCQTEFSLDELRASIEKMRNLQRDLAAIGKSWAF